MKKGIDYVGIFVVGICHDGQGNVLFRKRGIGARDEQGKWDPGVGGGLDQGESIEVCLVREMLEEASVEPLTSEYLGHMEKFRTLDGHQTHWLGFYFKCLVDREKVICNDEETDETFWAPFEKYPNPMMIGFEDTFTRFKDKFLII